MILYLASADGDINAVDTYFECTPLHFACRRKWRECTLTLLEWTASVEARSLDGLTPLMVSVIAQDTNTVTALVSAKADPYYLDDEKGNVLHLAVNLESTLMVRYFLSKGFHAIDAKHPADGAAALHLAVSCGFTDIVLLLLMFDANPDAITFSGLTPLP